MADWLKDTNRVKGYLFEVAIAKLLQKNGYQPIFVDPRHPDPSLYLDTKNGLHVHGRGERHQIDVIADYCYQQPFSHPQRLLIDAKNLTEPISIGVVNNAIGVLKDVSEFWHTNKKPIPGLSRSRAELLTPYYQYHYQFAICSASGYSAGVERLAFAEDIALIPVAHSRFFRPILEAINVFCSNVVKHGTSSTITVKRADFQTALHQRMFTTTRSDTTKNKQNITLPPFLEKEVSAFVKACNSLVFASLASSASGSPLLFIANPAEYATITALTESVAFQPKAIEDISSQCQFDFDPTDESWLLKWRDNEDQEHILFSFDFAPALMRLVLLQETEYALQQKRGFIVFTCTLPRTFEPDEWIHPSQDSRTTLNFVPITIKLAEIIAYLASTDEYGYPKSQKSHPDSTTKEQLPS